MTFAPGWYQAQGDPPGTYRYWDGTTWVGEPTHPELAAPGMQIQSTAGASTNTPAQGGFDESYGAYEVVTTQRQLQRQTPVQAAGPPEEFTFLPGLKILAIYIAVLKAIPLVLNVVALRWLLADDTRLIRAYGRDGAEVVKDATNTVYVVLAALGGVLLAQVLVALARRPFLLFCISGLLALIDLGLLWLATAGGGIVAVVLYGAMALAQGTLALWAFNIWRNG